MLTCYDIICLNMECVDVDIQPMMSGFVDLCIWSFQKSRVSYAHIEIPVVGTQGDVTTAPYFEIQLTMSWSKLVTPYMEM